jgi:hypothetical protein
MISAACASSPPDAHSFVPIRIPTPLGDSPSTQWAAVSTHSGEISEPPQKCPLPPCNDTMNE